MATRAKLEPSLPSGGGSYFAAPASVQTFSSGCALLDCALGGGYPIGRVVNVVGDKSTGKTLLAIEATANFATLFPKGVIRYCEVEAAFDKPYAQALGLPLERVSFADKVFTVEEWYDDIVATIKGLKDRECLYILDSLDALSDKAEQERSLDEGTFGANKAKKMGELFRKLIQHVESSKMTILIISQERDAIGVSFGEKSTRSGGRALDFYASQILWLHQMGQLKKTRTGIERTYGIKIKAKVKKNKIGLPFREAEFPIIFGYGVDDLVAGVEWLIKIEETQRISFSKEDAEKFVKNVEKLTPEQTREYRDLVNETVKHCWWEIEKEFVSTRKKY